MQDLEVVEEMCVHGSACGRRVGDESSSDNFVQVI